jgi:hypothetical protein
MTLIDPQWCIYFPRLLRSFQPCFDGETQQNVGTYIKNDNFHIVVDFNSLDNETKDGTN